MRLGNFGLGFLYRMDGNEKESFSYFKKAADCGNAGAQRVLGLIYGGSHQAMTAQWKDASVAETAGNDHLNSKKEDKKNGGDEGATAKAILHLYFAAMGGDAPAQLALGTRHLYGRGVPKICSTAVLYWQAAAESAAKSVEERGMSVLWSLSYFHSTQVTVSKDDVQATPWKWSRGWLGR